MTAGRLRSLVLAVAVLGAVSACKGPAVPHPLAGQSRHLCCNLRYEKTKITDGNYQVGAVVPLGTPVEIQEIRKNQVTFVPAGHPPLTLVYRYGRKAVPFDDYLNRLFVADDPRARLPKVTGRDKKARARAETLRQHIEHGVIDQGMTREQVLMAIGLPPAHRTPSLESPAWTYWQNAFVTFVVQFDGDKVASVTR